MRLCILLCLFVLAAGKESLVKKNEEKAKELIMLEIEPIFHDGAEPRSGQGKRAARPATRAVFGTSPGQYLLKSEDGSQQQIAPEVPAEYLGLLQQLVAQQQQEQQQQVAGVPQATATHSPPVIQQLVVERDPQPVVSRFTTTVDQAQLLAAQRQANAVRRRQQHPAARQQQELQQVYYDQRVQPQRRVSSTPAPAPQNLVPQVALPQADAHAIHEARLRASLSGQNPNLAVQNLAQLQQQQVLIQQQEQDSLFQQQHQQALAQQQHQQALAQQQQQQPLIQQHHRLSTQGIVSTTSAPNREEALFQQQLERLAAQAQAEEQQLAQISAISQAHEQLQLTKQQLSALTQAQERQIQQRLNAQPQLQLQQAVQLPQNLQLQQHQDLQQQVQQQHDAQQQFLRTQSVEPQPFPLSPPPDTRPTSIGPQQPQYFSRAQNAQHQLPQLQQGLELSTTSPQYLVQSTQAPIAHRIPQRRPPSEEQYLREVTVQDRPRARRPQSQLRPAVNQQLEQIPQNQDDDVISSLLSQSNRGLFASGKTSVEDALNIIQPSTPNPPSRSAIFVSSSVKSPQSSRFTIEDAIESPRDDKPVPVVRLPTPNGQRPLTQSEFQSLLSAGFKITPVSQQPTEGIETVPAVQLYQTSPKRQRSYATSSPPTKNQVVQQATSYKEQNLYQSSGDVQQQTSQQYHQKEPLQHHQQGLRIVVPDEPEVSTRLAPIYVPDIPEGASYIQEEPITRRTVNTRRPNQYRQRSRGAYRAQSTTESEYSAHDSIPDSTSSYSTRSYRQRSRRPVQTYEQ